MSMVTGHHRRQEGFRRLKKDIVNYILPALWEYSMEWFQTWGEWAEISTNRFWGEWPRAYRIHDYKDTITKLFSGHILVITTLY